MSSLIATIEVYTFVRREFAPYVQNAKKAEPMMRASQEGALLGKEKGGRELHVCAAITIGNFILRVTYTCRRIACECLCPHALLLSLKCPPPPKQKAFVVNDPCRRPRNGLLMLKSEAAFILLEATHVATFPWSSCSSASEIMGIMQDVRYIHYRNNNMKVEPDISILVPQ